jgi:hypothetical protein
MTQHGRTGDSGQLASPAYVRAWYRGVLAG